MRKILHFFRIVLLIVSGLVPVVFAFGAPVDVQLPPVEQRKILGTWLAISFSGVSYTRSFEAVNGKVYDVMRGSDGTGGKTGHPIVQLDAKKFHAPAQSKDVRYVIQSNGNLSLRDQKGEFDVLVVHAGLWPKPPVSASVRAASPPATEDSKTVGLTCYEVGFRYGHTGTSAFRGKKTNRAWDFATPGRCRGNPETERGILAGTAAAS
jgi:hypothetical protein